MTDLSWLHGPPPEEIFCACGKSIVRVHSAYHPWLHTDDTEFCNDDPGDLKRAWPKEAIHESD